MRPRSDPTKMKNSTQTALPHFNFSATAELKDVRSRLIILINEEINEANCMISNSAKLDRRTKQHTQFGVSESHGSRDLAVKKRKKKNEHPLRRSLIIIIIIIVILITIIITIIMNPKLMVLTITIIIVILLMLALISAIVEMIAVWETSFSPDDSGDNSPNW